MNPADTPDDATRAAKATRFFVPILAGARLGERMLGCAGALLGIVLTAFICRWALGGNANLLFFVAPVGASTVLLFAVPASPLAQPWPIIGGNTISALVGVAVAHLVPDPLFAIGLAGALAIAAMSFTRCLHPPGGAVALTAVLGGPAVTSVGFLFACVPVGLNSVLLVVLGILFHKISRRSYPHKPSPFVSVHQTSDISPERRVGFKAEDIDHALETLRETFDISTADLDMVLRQVEMQALLRSHGTILCEDIMSRDVVTVNVTDDPSLARARLINHDVRALPVLDAQGHVTGTIGLRELSKPQGTIGALMSPAAVASRAMPALTLLPTLTDGKSHAVVIVDENIGVEGLITQTDLLSAVTKLIPTAQ